MRINSSNPFARTDGGVPAGTAAKRHENSQEAPGTSKSTSASSPSTHDSYERSKTAGVFDQRQTSLFRSPEASAAGASESRGFVREAAREGSLPRLPELPENIGALNVPMKGNGAMETILQLLESISSAQAVAEGVSGEAGSHDQRSPTDPCLLCDDPQPPEWAKTIISRAYHRVSGGDIRDVVESIGKAALGQRGEDPWQAIGEAVGAIAGNIIDERGPVTLFVGTIMSNPDQFAPRRGLQPGPSRGDGVEDGEDGPDAPGPGRPGQSTRPPGGGRTLLPPEDPPDGYSEDGPWRPRGPTTPPAGEPDDGSDDGGDIEPEVNSSDHDTSAHGNRPEHARPEPTPRPQRDGSGDSPGNPEDTHDTPSREGETLSAVDDLIKKWENSGDKELGEDPATGHGGRGGSEDLGARAHLAKAPRGLTQQQKDFVGPAFATTTGADDKERPATGGTSGKPSTNDLDNDVGGGHRLQSSRGPQAGNLAVDMRPVSPIDPGKV